MRTVRAAQRCGLTRQKRQVVRRSGDFLGRVLGQSHQPRNWGPSLPPAAARMQATHDQRRSAVPLDSPCRDTDEQAACLLEQATDPNVLGRMYWGWKPFV